MKEKNVINIFFDFDHANAFKLKCRQLRYILCTEYLIMFVKKKCFVFNRTDN